MYTKPAQKRSESKRTKSSKNRISTKAKKGKVYIPAYKAIILCAMIIVACMCLLLFTTIKAERPTDTSTIAQRFEETTKVPEKEQSENIVKSEQKKQSENSKVEKEKTAETKKNQQKTDENKAKPVQTPNVKPEQKQIPAPAPKKKLEQTSTPVQKTKNSVYNFPKAKSGAKLIFVFDDAGQNNAQLENFLSLPFPITVAVLPQLANSVSAAQKIRNSGNEVILHQPMQSINTNVNPGAGAISPDMSEAEIISQLFVNINQIGPIAGMNNHEGSLITADAEKVAIILQVASDNGIYFLDSRTNVETKIPYVAHEMGYSYFERNIFLDNEKTKENALKELKKGLDIANKNGNVIMIGHIWSADFLPQFLKEVYPELITAGYTFSTVSKSGAMK